MILYKCDEWDPSKCNTFDECKCRCTFSPIHIWGEHPVIMEYLEAKAPFNVSSEGCPAGKDECTMTFYKEVEDESDILSD